MNFKKGHSYYNYKQTIISSNHLKDEDGIIFAAKTRAERKFEELPEPGDYDD